MTKKYQPNADQNVAPANPKTEGLVRMRRQGAAGSCAGVLAPAARDQERIQSRSPSPTDGCSSGSSWYQNQNGAAQARPTAPKMRNVCRHPRAETIRAVSGGASAPPS